MIVICLFEKYFVYMRERHVSRKSLEIFISKVSDGRYEKHLDFYFNILQYKKFISDF